jgi:hypothetical protein
MQATIGDLNRQIASLKAVARKKDQTMRDMENQRIQEIASKDEEAQRERAMTDKLKADIDQKDRAFRDLEATQARELAAKEDELQRTVKDLEKLKDTHLEELRQADDAIRNLGAVISKLKQELGAVQSALLSHSGQGGEEEEDVERRSKSGASGSKDDERRSKSGESGPEDDECRSKSGESGSEDDEPPSKSDASCSGGELKIRTILGGIGKLEVELASACERAVQLSGPIAEALGPRVPQPTVSISYLRGLRGQVFICYFCFLVLFGYWLSRRE